MSKSSEGRVVVYTTRYCPYCSAAKDFLQSKSVSFREVDVTDTPEMRRKLVEMSGGRTTVPQIFVDDHNIGGYQELIEYYRSGHTI